MLKLTALPVILSLLLHGCASTPEPVTDLQTYFRGIIRAADNQLQIRACDQSQWQSSGIIDATLREALIQRFAGAPLGIGVYLEAWGRPDQPIVQLQMLGGDIATCQHQLSGISLRAGGLEPVWYADVKPGLLEVHNSTALKSWRFNDPQLTRSANRWVWSGQNASLEVKRAPCFDLLGVEYAFTASFSAGATQLRGCARYGDLQRSLLKARYYSRDANRERQIGLELRPTEEFTLSLIDRQGQRESFTGRWRILTGGQLLLQVEDERLSGAGGSLRFLPSGAAFKLANAHPLFGTQLLLLPGTETLLAVQRATGIIP